MDRKEGVRVLEYPLIEHCVEETDSIELALSGASMATSFASVTAFSLMKIFSCFYTATRNHRKKMFGGRDTFYIGGSTVCGPDSSDYSDSDSEYSDSAKYSSPGTSIARGSSISDTYMKSYNDHRQISRKVEHKDYGGGCSGKVTKTSKSGAMVDGRNGNRVYKEEVGYDYSLKVKDEKLGITTQYDTQVKHKKTTSYANPSSRSGGGKSSSMTGYTFAEPSKSLFGVQIENSSGTSTK